MKWSEMGGEEEDDEDEYDEDDDGDWTEEGRREAMSIPFEERAEIDWQGKSELKVSNLSEPVVKRGLLTSREPCLSLQKRRSGSAFNTTPTGSTTSSSAT